MLRSPKIAIIIAALTFPLGVAPAHAQDADRMAEVVETEAASGSFMGAALVAKGDQVILDEAWGSANLEWGVDNTSLTKFRIGSVTKQFTAVSILLLQEQGKLNLDDPIKTHFPDAPEAWDAITIRHLLQHTSGITNVTSLDEFGRFKFLPITQEELIAKFEDLPLEFEPGTRWSYSNSGYVLLSALVAKLSEQEYGDFVREKLFDPLGMKETGIDDSAVILPKRAAGYSPGENGAVNAEYVNMGIPTGAGALYSTTGDLLRWQRALFGGQVLSEASMAEYLTPAPFDAFSGDQYALGVLIRKDGEHTSYWHGGGIEGFNAWLGYDPNADATVVVLANLNGGAATKLGNQLMELVRGGDVVLPDERVEGEIATTDLAQYVGTYALAPTFKITITQDGESLMAQATGQQAFEIFPESEDRFFYKVVDAQIRFERDESGEVSSLTLFQAGRELPGAKE